MCFVFFSNFASTTLSKIYAPIPKGNTSNCGHLCACECVCANVIRVHRRNNNTKYRGTKNNRPK